MPTHDINERKLQYFAETIQHEVTTRKQQALQQAAALHKKNALTAISAAKRRNKIEIVAMQNEMQRDANKQVAQAKVQAISAYVQTRDQLADRLCIDVTARLAAFTQDEKYENYMITRIKHMMALLKPPVAFAIIKLSPHDMRFESNIKDATGLTAEVGSQDYIGGFILLDEARSVQADYTFKTLLDLAKKEPWFQERD